MSLYLWTWFQTISISSSLCFTQHLFQLLHKSTEAELVRQGWLIVNTPTGVLEQSTQTWSFLLNRLLWRCWVLNGKLECPSPGLECPGPNYSFQNITTTVCISIKHKHNLQLILHIHISPPIGQFSHMTTMYTVVTKSPIIIHRGIVVQNFKGTKELRMIISQYYNLTVNHKKYPS